MTTCADEHKPQVLDIKPPLSALQALNSPPPSSLQEALKTSPHFGHDTKFVHDLYGMKDPLSALHCQQYAPEINPLMVSTEY